MLRCFIARATQVPHGRGAGCVLAAFIMLFLGRVPNSQFSHLAFSTSANRVILVFETIYTRFYGTEFALFRVIWFQNAFSLQKKH